MSELALKQPGLLVRAVSITTLLPWPTHVFGEAGRVQGPADGNSDCVGRPLPDVKRNAAILAAASNSTQRPSALRFSMRVLTAVAWLVVFLLLMLSPTGIHALTSFTVAGRTREIGIRAALGAHHGRLVASIFSRAFLQIGGGIVVGSGLAALAALAGLGSVRQVVLLIGADAIMLVVGLVACAVPVRRALRIDPMAVLRAE